MRTAQPTMAVMIAECGAMSKSPHAKRSASDMFGGAPVASMPSRESRAVGGTTSTPPPRISESALARNLTEEARNGCGNDEPSEEPSKCAEAVILKRPSAA
jgi:hypothetical protein